MSDQLRDRLAGAALGALDPSDSAELAAEVERDPTLAAELHGYRTTVAMPSPRSRERRVTTCLRAYGRRSGRNWPVA